MFGAMTFKPGQSGNPRGRPKKGYSIREHLRASMADEITIPGKDGKPDQVIAKGAFLSSKLFQLAASGDLAAIKLCLDNVDGPPVQKVEQTNIDAPAPLDPAEALAAAKASEDAGEV